MVLMFNIDSEDAEVEAMDSVFDLVLFVCLISREDCWTKKASWEEKELQVRLAM